MRITDYCLNHSNLAIYGAGIVAEHLLISLREAGIVPRFCIVTESKNEKRELYGMQICTLMECVSTLKEGHYGILIGVSEKYQDEVIKSLDRFELYDYMTLSDGWKKDLIRGSRPVDASLFLKKTTPVSDLFGCDRGTAVDRYYIEKFLLEESRQIGAVQRILEVGEDLYSRKYFSSEDTEHCILNYSKGMDLTDINTLVSGYYDVFICTQVFNFIYDIKAAIKGAYHLLKDGGIMLATVAGNISPVSQSDMKNYGHFWGFTYAGIEGLMKECFGKENVIVIPYGNALAATAFVQGICLEELPNLDLLDVADPNYAINIAIRAEKHER